ncbi:receptor-type tyrosine-protein phosphatase delta-like isoform X2 [Rhopilema esculentum]|uniref:receptor-type tyrosine-protein phosphatase delta-like isoform X2 n=1 Tax=Rhopilema esculentum TaxID=499914 RepID=UPI0031D7F220
MPRELLIAFIISISFIDLVFPSCLESKSLGTGQGTESQNIGTGTTFENHNASQTELNNGTGWCVKNDIAPSLVIKFNKLITVSKVGTQGAILYNETYFASNFRLQFGYDDGKWYGYQKNSEPVVFMGNTDSVTVVNNNIQETMAKVVKIVPIFPESKNIICLRMELYGCKYALKPKLTVDRELLILKYGESDSIMCNTSGQVGMTSSWQKPPSDVRSTEHVIANRTYGIFHKMSRKLSFVQPAIFQNFDGSCALEKKDAVVVCKKNYTCLASYWFDRSVKSAKRVDVHFEKGITYNMLINSGSLSPVHIDIGSVVNLKCSARTQDTATIKWYHRAVKAWNSSAETKKERHLNFYRENDLSFTPSSSVVINTLTCSRGKAESNEIRCDTKFNCKVNYNFNESLFEEKQVDVAFFIPLPKQPDSPRAECTSDMCTLSWSLTDLGGVVKSNLYYSVSINGDVRTTSLQDQAFVADPLDPNEKYTAAIKALVKKSDGTLVWESQPVSLNFETKPSSLTTKQKILSVKSTSNNITFNWEKTVLPPENGKVLKYDLTLVQTMYGNLDVKRVYMLTPIQSVTNVDSETTQFTFRRLKPWSRYQLKIRAVNNHFMPGPSTEFYHSTKEAVPSVPPGNIQGYHVQPSYIILRWEQPLFVTLNGRLTHYVVRWRPIKTQRSIRSTGNLEKLVDKLVCQPHCQVKIDSLEPFQVYGFQVAAKNVVDVGKFSAEKSVRTAQAAPSAPHSLTYNENKTTFFLIWKAPIRPNGILKEYEIKLKAEGSIITRFTESTDLFYDTKINSSDSIEFKVRGYTSDFHNIGGLAGDWSSWATAKRYITPIKPSPQSSQDGSVLAIVLSFLAVLILLIILITVFFVFYRRRERGRNRQKLEVEMDSVAEIENDEDINVITGEDIPLTRSNGSGVDVPSEEHSHLPIPVEEFHSYVSRMNESDGEPFHHQYRYELMSGKCCSTEVALRNENKPKNRYVNIVAYDHSRVILKPEAGRRHIHHHGETDYFNANYIEGYCPQSTSKYIACQGPMQSIFTDFWRMVWQENSSVIVMLTNLEEGGKIKCDQYWPSEGARRYGHITVRFRNCDQTADYLIRYFEIEKGTGKEKEKRTVVQFHFISWPDNHIPELATAILSLRRRVRHHYCGGAPMIVHCSAGVGRTGCFILIDAMLERIDSGEGNVDIFNYLQYMRTRRINMVQTAYQYIFAHTAVLEYITFGDNEISAIDFEGKLRELKINRSIEEEFRLIESTSPDLESLDNTCKVLLKNGKFIEVFYIDGYKQRDAFFLCNSPSKNMVPDFWRMLVEQGCHTVVMLNCLEEEDNYKYWPEIYANQIYGNYTVALTSEQQTGNIATRKIKISSADAHEEEFEVQHLQFLEWPSDGVPKNRNSILTLMSLVEKSRQNYGNGPVLVHSGNGAGRSGTFIAVSNSTERLKVEQIIDVLQCVRAIRSVVPIAVGNWEQYEFIYEMIRTYLEGFETYSNFTDGALSVEM